MLGVWFALVVLFVVDEYYCSETTTAQASLGYVSLEQLGIHGADTRASQPKTAVHHLPGLLCAHLIFMYMYSPLLVPSFLGR